MDCTKATALARLMGPFAGRSHVDVADSRLGNKDTLLGDIAGVSGTT
jgi:hypothetical protein